MDEIRDAGGAREDRQTCASYAVVAQLVEHIHGKDEVTGSIPVNGSTHAGWVPKRSNGADCKSVGPAPSKVRILPHPPYTYPASRAGYCYEFSFLSFDEAVL